MKRNVGTGLLLALLLLAAGCFPARSEEMILSPKEGTFSLGKRTITFYNQASEEWSHPYPSPGGEETLHTSGCGIFSTAVLLEFFSGEKTDVCALADFACAQGAGTWDGTDRVSLARAMEKAGMDDEYGFRWDGKELTWNPEKLWDTLSGGGVALCNLRVGHIVSVIGCRARGGERQVLVVDSACESAEPAIRDGVRQVREDSAVTKRVYNKDGVCVGTQKAYAVYWYALQECGASLLFSRK